MFARKFPFRLSNRFWKASAVNRRCHATHITKNQQCFRELVFKVYSSAINVTSPWSMVEQVLHYDNNVLTIEDTSYNIDNNVHVVAFGKAVLSMAKAVEHVLGDHIVSAIASVPKGSLEGLRHAGKSELLLDSDTKFQVYEGGEGFLPDEQSYEAAKKILEIVNNLKEKDLLICLISSGGSSLLPAPIPPLTLQGKKDTIELLRLAGASAKDINLVRKHISLVKGGGLGARASPAKVVSLILSNIVDEEPFAVASSPTVGDMSTPQQALEVLRKYKATSSGDNVVNEILMHKIDRSEFKRWIEKGPLDLIVAEDPGQVYMGPRPRHDCSHVQNILVGSNLQLIEAAKNECKKHGIIPYVLDSTMRCQSTKMAKKMAYLAHFICEKLSKKRINKALIDAELNCSVSGIHKRQLVEVSKMAEKAVNTGKPLCIINAGELTVKVKGEGKGGQNQEFSLACAIELRKLYKEHLSVRNCEVQVLSVDTDGFDGATDVSGAFSDCFQAEHVFGGQTAEDFLKNNDSLAFYNSFPDGIHTVATGLTGTDILDVQLMLIQSCTAPKLP